MHQKQLKKEDRYQIEILLGRGYKQCEIANVLGFQKATISREIRRRKRKRYTYKACDAHLDAQIKRSNSKYQGMKIEKDTVLREKIIIALKQHQSPECIAGRYGGISHMSIYKWVYSPFGQRYCKHLCTRRYRKKQRNIQKVSRTTIPHAVSIHERPTEGVHWEGDLFVSPQKYGHSVSVAMLVEQESQYICAIRIPNRKPCVMVSAVKRLAKDIYVDDITWDRGIENRYHKQFGTINYFCDPYAPWQKPHVENNIGLLRKWFVPKKTDLRCMNQRQLNRYVRILNNKWRKSLGYKSASEAAKENGVLLRDKLRLGV